MLNSAIEQNTKRYLAGEKKEIVLVSIVCYILIIPSELQKDHIMLSYSSHARSQ